MTGLFKGAARRGVTAGLVGLLAACGGGGGGGGAPPEAPTIATAADALFPADTTARWTYATTAGTGTVVTRTAGVQAGGSGTVVRLRVVDPNEPSDDTTAYVVGSSGVRLSSAADTDPLVRALDGIELLRWPVKAGDSWTQYDGTVSSGEDFDLDGRIDTVTQRAETVAVASESVTTPAGTFDRCLHQRQTLRQTANFSSGRPAVVITTVVDSWYAPNVGTVKTVYAVTSAATGTQTSTETLSAWRIGTRGTDTVAPTVTAVAPSATAQGAQGVVSATLDEAIDADSAIGSLTVVDSTGTRVDGTVQVENRTVRFLALQAWASGRYTARLAGVTDVMGNPLAAARTWAFDIDASPPTVASVTPADGADDLALDGIIVLRFNEPVSAASAVAGNFILSDGQGSVPLAVTVDGATVTLRPTVALQRARPYQFTAFGIADAYGNLMAAPFSASFRSTQGRFAYAKPLVPGYASGTVAVGDINGDGINDVVTLGQLGDVTSAQLLLVLIGRADGTLSAPQVLSLNTVWNCGAINALALGDFNGDGRMDVAVSSIFCDTGILFQQADGQLSSTAFRLGYATSSLAAADLDGDGRTDLVGVGNSAEAYVWIQGADGRFGLPQRPGLFSAARQVVVGDVNGDGRPDLVVTMQGSSGLDVAVLLNQRTFFSAPQYLTTRSPWGATAVALGDLNGDGRTDIVVTAGGNSPTSIVVWYQAADGSLGAATPVATYDIPTEVAVADVDGDGRADVVVTHAGWSAVGVYLQQAGGTLAAEVRYVADVNGGNRSLAVADVNRDGRPDILVEGRLLLQRPTAVGASAVTPGRPGIGGVARALRAAAAR